MPNRSAKSLKPTRLLEHIISIVRKKALSAILYYLFAYLSRCISRVVFHSWRCGFINWNGGICTNNVAGTLVIPPIITSRPWQVTIEACKQIEEGCSYNNIVVK